MVVVRNLVKTSVPNVLGNEVIGTRTEQHEEILIANEGDQKTWVDLDALIHETPPQLIPVKDELGNAVLDGNCKPRMIPKPSGTRTRTSLLSKEARSRFTPEQEAVIKEALGL